MEENGVVSTSYDDLISDACSKRCTWMVTICPLDLVRYCLRSRAYWQMLTHHHAPFVGRHMELVLQRREAERGCLWFDCWVGHGKRCNACTRCITSL